MTTEHKRCLVAICHNGPVVFTDTVQSLMEIGWGSRVQAAKDAYGFDGIDFAWSRSMPRVDALRDSIVHRALTHPAKYTHVLFLDADMVWPTDLLVKMLKHHDRHGIVSGLYHIKSGDYSPVAMKHGRVLEDKAVRLYEYDFDYRDGDEDVRDVDVVGMGCTLIPMAVFRALERPWFHYENDSDGWPIVSEDIPLCRKAKEAGFGVWFDRSVKCGHVTLKTVTEKWHIAASDGIGSLLMDHAVQAQAHG